MTVQDLHYYFNTIPAAGTFAKYQEAAEATAIYPEAGESTFSALMYLSNGLAAESGEVVGKFAKAIRDEGYGEIDETGEERIMLAARREGIVDELGDVLWFITLLASELGYDLSDIAQRNQEKLEDRAQRNALRGSGDNR